MSLKLFHFNQFRLEKSALPLEKVPESAIFFEKRLATNRLSFGREGFSPPSQTRLFSKIIAEFLIFLKLFRTAQHLRAVPLAFFF